MEIESKIIIKSGDTSIELSAQEARALCRRLMSELNIQERWETVQFIPFIPFNEPRTLPNPYPYYIYSTTCGHVHESAGHIHESAKSRKLIGGV